MESNSKTKRHLWQWIAATALLVALAIGFVWYENQYRPPMELSPAADTIYREVAWAIDWATIYNDHWEEAHGRASVRINSLPRNERASLYLALALTPGPPGNASYYPMILEDLLFESEAALAKIDALKRSTEYQRLDGKIRRELDSIEESLLDWGDDYRRP